MQDFYDSIQTWTEKKLTQRKAKKQYQKDHKTIKNEILSWVDALLFAVVVVFILNQFLFQLFVIPSPSMQNTLLIGDRVFVSKCTYGLEIFPYGPKILDSRSADRDDIITFYNPDYESKGTGFSILSRMLYMATFGLCNIEVDENGNPGEWLLVKRCAGKSGDTVTFRDGDAYIKPAGCSTYIKETDFREENGYVTAPKREIKKDTYIAYKSLGRANGIQSVANKVSYIPKHLLNDYDGRDEKAFYTDYYGYEKWCSEGVRMADPCNADARSEWTKKNLGLYVPEGCVLPLGDNRDNSTDGRYFGPVSEKTITGFVASRIWPLSRISSLVNK